MYPIGSAYTNMTFENNLIYDPLNTTTAKLQDLGDNFVFRNNTVIGDVHTYVYPGYDGSNIHLHNNLMRAWTLYNLDPLPNIDEGSNIVRSIVKRYPTYYNNVSFPAGSTSITYGGDDALFNALFADRANKDFSLAPGSAAIAFADPANASATDLNGVSRDPVCPDAGAFEFVGGPVPGDADGDGDVDLDDFVILKTTFGQVPLLDDRADFDSDGDVDLDDFVILKTNFGS